MRLLQDPARLSRDESEQVLASAAYHVAKAEGTTAAWDALLPRTGDLRRRAAGDPTAERIVTTVANSALVDRALTEPDVGPRLAWLQHAQDAQDACPRPSPAAVTRTTRHGCPWHHRTSGLCAASPAPRPRPPVRT
jgi:hypothetical protein